VFSQALGVSVPELLTPSPPRHDRNS
jgi:hypothetical protein